MKFSLKLFLIFITLWTALSACDGKRKTLVEISNEKQILLIANGEDPADVDPHTTTGTPEHHIQNSIFEGLVTQDLRTQAVKPAVSDSWTVSEDGKIYRFHIRDTAKWSNGDKLVAQDFIDSYKRALMPALANQWASYLYVIENAEAFYDGRIKDFDQVGVKAISDQELEIRLASSTPYFLQLLDHPATFPVHIKTIKKFGAVDQRSTAWTRPENFVGNGPFIIKEWVPQKVFAVKKNPLYWDAKNVKLNEIRYFPIVKESDMERAYRAGQVHVVERLPIGKIAKYKNSNDSALRTFPMYGTYFYRFNTKIKPFDDVRVRRALAYVIDRESLVKNISKGGELPAYALTPPNPAGYTPRAKIPYDIPLAKKLLAEAGYPDGNGFPVMSLLYNTQENHQQLATALQQMWKDNLGIHIELENTEWKTFLENQRTMNYQMCRASWIGDYVDPDTFLQLMITDGGNNETGWSSAHYDQLIRDAAQTVDQQQRFEIFQKAEQMIVDEVPVIPIYTYSWNRLVSPSVVGWENHLMDFFAFKDVYLQSAEKP